MDNGIVYNLLQMQPEDSQAKIELLGKYDPNGELNISIIHISTYPRSIICKYYYMYLFMYNNLFIYHYICYILLYIVLYYILFIYIYFFIFCLIHFF